MCIEEVDSLIIVLGANEVLNLQLFAFPPGLTPFHVGKSIVVLSHLTIG